MLTAIGDVMREAYKRGWITTRDGNISLRKKDTMYITPSAVRKYIIHPEHIIKGKVFGAEVLFNKDVTPSGELSMHINLQTTQCFSGTRAIVHLHPTNIIAAIHAGLDLQKITAAFPEVSRYTKVGKTVGVVPPVSEELAIATYHNMTDNKGFIAYDIVGQANHGVTSVAKHPWAAFEAIERLEHVCQIVLLSGVKDVYR
jgi:ribulose-5-phosphate 4-epimerase/fuculose-1-phosphate aldolase